jgi:hypothetical protein
MAGGWTRSCDSRHSDKLFVDEERKKRERKERTGGALYASMYTSAFGTRGHVVTKIPL